MQGPSRNVHVPHPGMLLKKKIAKDRGGGTLQLLALPYVSMTDALVDFASPTAVAPPPLPQAAVSGVAPLPAAWRPWAGAPGALGVGRLGRASASDEAHGQGTRMWRERSVPFCSVCCAVAACSLQVPAAVRCVAVRIQTLKRRCSCLRSRSCCRALPVGQSSHATVVRPCGLRAAQPLRCVPHRQAPHARTRPRPWLWMSPDQTCAVSVVCAAVPRCAVAQAFAIGAVWCCPLSRSSMKMRVLGHLAVACGLMCVRPCQTLLRVEAGSGETR